MTAGRAADGPVLEALQRLGAKRVEAILLVELLARSPQGTKDLVSGTGLRQPEVSVGMQVLRDRGWVETEPIPRQGKGRPMHQYRLTADAKEIRTHYEAHAETRMRQFKDAVEVLRKGL